MAEMVYERGYTRATVRELVKRSRVSKRTFYELYDGKEACFRSAYDEATEDAIEWVAASTVGSANRSDLADRGLEAFAAAVALRPKAAYLAMLEPLSVGGAARGRMRRTENAFAELTRSRFEDVPDGSRLPMLLVHGIVAGVARIARNRLNSARPDSFKDDIGDLRDWVVAVTDSAVLRLPTVSTGAGMRAASERGPRRLRLPMNDDRTLLINATLRLATKGGYDQLNATRIAAAAGLSKRRFDANFASVDDCFARTIEIGVAAGVGEALFAFESADDWPLGVHLALASVCRFFAAEPGMARLAFVEVLAPGRPAAREATGLLTTFASLLRQKSMPDTGISSVSAEASVGAIWTVLRRWVAGGHSSALPRLGPTLSWLALAPAIGGGAVIDIVSRIS
jgi:AcrR family transcriptional regulator